MYKYVLAVAVMLVMTLVTSTAFTADTNTVSSTVVTDKAPPTASAPSVVVNNNDVCKSAYSASIQTQIFGVASGITVTDENCELIKLARSLYGMGMKVAAVSTLCQDPRVFDAMIMAGTPCPYRGKIGKDADEAWKNNPNDVPDGVNFYVEAPPPPPEPEPGPDLVTKIENVITSSTSNTPTIKEKMPEWCKGNAKWHYNRSGRELNPFCEERRWKKEEETEPLTFEIIEESFTSKEEPVVDKETDGVGEPVAEEEPAFELEVITSEEDPEEVTEPEITVEELPASDGVPVD